MKSIFKVLTILIGCLCFVFAIISIFSAQGWVTDPILVVFVAIILFLSGSWHFGLFFYLRELEDKLSSTRDDIKKKIYALEDELDDLKDQINKHKL